MKKSFIIVIAMFIVQSCSAQQKKLELSDLTSNKYFKSESASNLVGRWASSDGSYIAITSTKIKSLQKGDVGISTDAIVIKFEKFSYNNKNIALELKDSIELYPSSSPVIFSGEHIDPLTHNTIKLLVKYIDKKTIQIFCENSIMGDSKKGTVFPSKIELVSIK